jgi:Protein of unknown function (DUF3987)
MPRELPFKKVVPFDEAVEPWPELEAGLLEDVRPTAPAFPLKLLPADWARWIADCAEAAGSAVDYVAQGVLAAVASVCGAGVRVKVTQAWSEPLVLWCAVVGSPSSGKSPALASVRALVGAIEEGQRENDDERRGDHAAKLEQARLADERWREACEAAHENGTPMPRRPTEAAFDRPFVPAQLVVSDATIEALADVVQGNPRGVILWRDELAAWLANLGRYANGGSDRAQWLEAWAAAGVTINRRSRGTPMHLPNFPVSVIGSIQPDRLAEAFQGSDDGMAARFLYAWPGRPKYRSLMQRRIAREDDALAMLQHIASVAGSPEEPAVLAFDAEALQAMDTFLERLEGALDQAEGLEESWLGKGRGTVARLAGILALMKWSETGHQGPPRRIGVETVANAIALWSSYFRPHAATVFGQCGRPDRDRHARRAAKWIKACALEQVSREELRREALGQAIDAGETDRVIQRLEQAGVIRLASVIQGAKGGRTARRWAVNPALQG